MSRRIVIAPPGKRLAIRVDDRTLLAVPPMRPGLPSEVRVRVFEYVLRRQYMLAFEIAEMGTAPTRGLTEAMVSERPHATGWGYTLAA